MKKTTPRFALDLARSGISVLHCNARQLWQPLGTVALTAPDFELALARLRKSTAECFGEDFETEIWLPNDQVLFRAVQLETQTSGDERTQEIKSALAAMSRIEPNELCFVEGMTDDKGFTHIAAVSMATWTEAVAFAEKWGFNSRKISTRLPAEGFDLPPVFTPPQQEPAKASRKIPNVIAAGFALALMLPAAIQLSSGQSDDPALKVFPAKIAVQAVESEQVPNVTVLMETQFGPISEEESNLRLPAQNAPVKTDAYFEQAAEAKERQFEDKSPVLRERGPAVFHQATALNYHQVGETVDFVRPEKATAVRFPIQSRLLSEKNAAPEVVDQHAVLWVAKLPVQSAFRSTGPNFERPSLNALRRSPGVLRLPRKLNFGPDGIPGLSVTSSGEGKDFLRRTLNNIEFDDVREQAMLDVGPRTPFADLRQSRVAQILSDTLLSRPAKRVQNGEREGDEIPRPFRRKNLAKSVTVKEADNPPRTDPVIQALRAPPDPGQMARPEPPSAENNVAMTRPAEAVLSIQLPSILIKKPARRSDLESEQAIVGKTIERLRPPSRINISVNDPSDTEPLQVSTIEPEQIVILRRPPQRSNKEQANSVSEVPLVETAAALATLQKEISLARPIRRKGERTTSVTSTLPPKGPVSKYAVTAMRSPKARPDGLRAAAAKIRKERNSVDAVVSKKQTPRKTVPASNLRLPSNASVKKAATIRNGINLRKISLLGVLGTSSQRRALIRLPRGSVVRVKRGANVDGWRVSAIGEQSVRLQKGSRSQVLRLPN